MKNLIKAQSMQTLAILFVFILKYEPGHELSAALAAMITGWLAAVIVVMEYIGKQGGAREIVSLASIALAGSLGFLAAPLEWVSLLLFGNLLAMVFSFFTMPAKKYQTAWPLMWFSLFLQMALIEFGMILIASISYS